MPEFIPPVQEGREEEEAGRQTFLLLLSLRLLSLLSWDPFSTSYSL